MPTTPLYYVRDIDLEVLALFAHQTQASHCHGPSSPFPGSSHSPAPLIVPWILTQIHPLNSGPLCSFVCLFVLFCFCAYSFLPGFAKLPCLSGLPLPFSECLDTQEVPSFFILYFPDHQTTGQNRTAFPQVHSVQAKSVVSKRAWL